MLTKDKNLSMKGLMLVVYVKWPSIPKKLSGSGPNYIYQANLKYPTILHGIACMIRRKAALAITSNRGKCKRNVHESRGSSSFFKLDK